MKRRKLVKLIRQEIAADRASRYVVITGQHGPKFNIRTATVEDACVQAQRREERARTNLDEARSHHGFNASGRSAPLKVSDPHLEFGDRRHEDRDTASTDGWTLSDYLLRELCELFTEFGRDGKPVRDAGGDSAQVIRGGRRVSLVVELHDCPPSCSHCGCSDTAPAAGGPAKNLPTAGGSQPTDEEGKRD